MAKFSLILPRSILLGGDASETPILDQDALSAVLAVEGPSRRPNLRVTIGTGPRDGIAHDEIVDHRRSEDRKPGARDQKPANDRNPDKQQGGRSGQRRRKKGRADHAEYQFTLGHLGVCRFALRIVSLSRDVSWRAASDASFRVGRDDMSALAAVGEIPFRHCYFPFVNVRSSRAAISGILRSPASHRWTVRISTPSLRASELCVSPRRIRIRFSSSPLTKLVIRPTVVGVKCAELRSGRSGARGLDEAVDFLGYAAA